MEELVYHYTTIECFQKILESSINKRTGKITELKFWASSIYAMNDPMEFLHGYNLICNSLPNMEKSIGIIDDKYKLSVLGDVKGEDEGKYNHNKIIETIYDSNDVPFILSFAKQKDFLPMWSTYANNGNGICLGISNNEYKIDFAEGDYSVEQLNNLHASDVCYDGIDEIVNRTLLNFYKSSYEEYRKFKSKELINRKTKCLAQMALIGAPYHKHEAYKYEQESRLIKFCNNIKRVKFRCNAKGRIIPYLEVPIKKEYLKEIIIGPCADSISLKREIKKELSKYDISVGLIVSSKVPYRVY